MVTMIYDVSLKAFVMWADVITSNSYGLLKQWSELQCKLQLFAVWKLHSLIHHEEMNPSFLPYIY